MKKNKVIGILGGMGPGASAEMYSKIIKYSQYEYGAVQDEDFPPVLINSLTLEGFDETGILDKDLVKKQLISGVKALEKGGSDLIIIACNTVHIFFDEMQQAVNVPLFNIIEETKVEVLKHDYKKVGLLCSQSTKEYALYQDRFVGIGIEIVVCNESEQVSVNKVIENVMGGIQSTHDIIVLKKIIRKMVKKGAESVILGCTEIPLAINQVHTDCELFDTMDAIIKKSVDFSLNKKLKSI